MIITIVHGGQTGVDRGGHVAARTMGWQVAGYMPTNRKDELGDIPRDVACWLTECPKPGYAARTKENLAKSSALLAFVQDAKVPEKTPGTKLTLEWAHKWGVRLLICDPTYSADRAATWLRDGLAQRRDAGKTGFRLMVAGPRESKWAGAQAETVRFLRHLHAELGV